MQNTAADPDLMLAMLHYLPKSKDSFIILLGAKIVQYAVCVPNQDVLLAMPPPFQEWHEAVTELECHRTWWNVHYAPLSTYHTTFSARIIRIQLIAVNSGSKNMVPKSVIVRPFPRPLRQR
ncbi:uncharacterized protein CIMG_11181 [Coccidioides immitis RS]|uniref:Uncharacterized protein n=2 Tax=Coccidioides immitis TaxID=5501 RepID=A0A0D8JX88_COCIM|nr:uncharacterized protein CIMG_11181 [Coccidioides immitis RS]KJF61551.1 hypothetical protein CIMG_11181 [Coccidioides immitis RS]